MPRAPSTFRPADLAKAVKAVRSAGVDIARVEVTKDGKISIITTAEPAHESSSLDAWMAKHGSDQA
jgi:hypothetical protein